MFAILASPSVNSPISTLFKLLCWVLWRLFIDLQKLLTYFRYEYLAAFEYLFSSNLLAVNFFHGILHWRETTGIQWNLLVFCLKACAFAILFYEVNPYSTYIKIFFHISPTFYLLFKCRFLINLEFSLNMVDMGHSTLFFLLKLSSFPPNHLLNNLQLFSLICSPTFTYVDFPGPVSECSILCGCSICSCTSSILFLSLCSNDIVSARVGFVSLLLFFKIYLFNIWFFFIELYWSFLKFEFLLEYWLV